MRLVFGSDHGGVVLRRHLVEIARELGHEVVAEFGAQDEDNSVDYSDVAVAVCREVTAVADTLGVLVCGTGQGVAMAANRIPGIRAAVLSDPFSAAMSRAHNDANVLCLGGRVVGQGLARVLLVTFLDGGFEGGRHARRVAKLQALERG